MIDEYLEFEKDTKNLKSLNLDNLSINELKEYIYQLKKEFDRVNLEVKKKN